MLLLRDLLRGCAHSFPQKLAFVDGERRRTWREIDDRASRLGAAMQQFGLGAGDVSAVLAHDHVEVVEHWYACWKTGIVRTGINWRYSPREMMHIIRDSGTKCLLVQAKCVSLLKDHQEELRALGIRVIGFGGDHGMLLDYETLLAEARPAVVEPPLDERDLVAISYTTGTTGLPKGALIEQRSVRGAVTQMVISMGLRHEDVWGSALPLPGIPILLVTFSVVNGMTTILPDGDFNVERFTDLLARHSVTATLLVPTMLRRVVDLVHSGRPVPENLRLMVYGSTPCPPALIREAQRTFGCEFQQYYGLTEGGGWFSCLRDGDHRRALEGRLEILASCGRQMIAGEMSIRGEEGEPLPVGEVGVLWVKGETLMRGYLNRIGDNKELFRGGWLRTHDIARVDHEGYFYLVDRKEFLIISGGYNVYPVVVENVLVEHPGVHEAAVVGAAHPEWGEAVVAAVTLRQGAAVTAEQIIAFCRTRLGKWEVPKFVDIVAELPKGATGKLLKKEVRDWYRKDPDRLPWSQVLPERERR